MTITSKIDMRGGQPCVGGSLPVGFLVPLVRGAGGIGPFLSSNDNSARLTRSEVEEALEFCARRKCTDSDTLEFCSNCTMLWTSAKTARRRDLVGRSDEEPTDDTSAEAPEPWFERIWEAAATIARS